MTVNLKKLRTNTQKGMRCIQSVMLSEAKGPAFLPERTTIFNSQPCRWSDGRPRPSAFTPYAEPEN